jgi:hypothetical protein
MSNQPESSLPGYHFARVGGGNTAEIRSLTAFIEGFFFTVFVQGDDEIFEIAYDKGVSRDLRQNQNNMMLDFEGFKCAIRGIRAAYSDRRIIEQSVTPAPANPADPTAVTSAHIASFSGVNKRREVVIIRVVAVGTAILQPGKGLQLAMESVVITTDEPVDPTS